VSTALYGFLPEIGKATMTTKGLEVGERIKVRISTPFVHAGRLGSGGDCAGIVSIGVLKRINRARVGVPFPKHR